MSLQSVGDFISNQTSDIFDDKRTLLKNEERKLLLYITHENYEQFQISSTMFKTATGRNTSL